MTLRAIGIDVHIALGGNLAHHVYHTGRRRHFASYMRGRVFRHDVVENCIGNLVANLVRVAFGHGFRCKKMFVIQDFAPLLFSLTAPTRNFRKKRTAQKMSGSKSSSFGIAMPQELAPCQNAGCRHQRACSLRHS